MYFCSFSNTFPEVMYDVLKFSVDTVIEWYTGMCQWRDGSNQCRFYGVFIEQTIILDVLFIINVNQPWVSLFKSNLKK